MVRKNTIFTTILIASLTLGNCGEYVIESIDVPFEASNLAPVATLTQLRVNASNSLDAVYTYKCSVGHKPIGHLCCSWKNSYSWAKPRGVKLELVCPVQGSGEIMSYAEIVFSVTTYKVVCETKGADGSKSIGLTVKAYDTKIFTFSAEFYAY